jgi:hypothetical protein
MAITIDGSDNKLEIGANATGPSSLRLYEDTDNGTHYIDIIAPSAVTSNRTLTLPDNTGTIVTSASSITASQLPTGSVLQVVSTFKNDVFSTTSSSFVDVTGLSVSITPASASNKILVFVSLGNVVDSGDVAYAILLRGSTQIANASGGDGVLGGGFTGGNVTGESYYGIRPICLTYLDSPSTTSSTTYKIQIRSNTGTAYLNRSTQNSNNYDRKGVSTITVMEIAA